MTPAYIENCSKVKFVLNIQFWYQKLGKVPISPELAPSRCVGHIFSHISWPVMRVNIFYFLFFVKANMAFFGLHFSHNRISYYYFKAVAEQQKKLTYMSFLNAHFKNDVYFDIVNQQCKECLNQFLRYYYNWCNNIFSSHLFWRREILMVPSGNSITVSAFVPLTPTMMVNMNMVMSSMMHVMMCCMMDSIIRRIDNRGYLSVMMSCRPLIIM